MLKRRNEKIPKKTWILLGLLTAALILLCCFLYTPTVSGLKTQFKNQINNRQSSKGVYTLGNGVYFKTFLSTYLYCDGKVQRVNFPYDYIMESDDFYLAVENTNKTYKKAHIFSKQTGKRILKIEEYSYYR